MTYALDTNAVIHILRKTPVVLKNFDRAVAKKSEIVIPPFVNYEMLKGFLYVKAPAKEISYDGLVRKYPIGEMTLEIWRRAAQIQVGLRRVDKLIEDADIIIAAFALEGGHTLVTGNTKHFERIDGLRLEDWTQA